MHGGSSTADAPHCSLPRSRSSPQLQRRDFSPAWRSEQSPPRSRGPRRQRLSAHQRTRPQRQLRRLQTPQKRPPSSQTLTQRQALPSRAPTLPRPNQVRVRRSKRASPLPRRSPCARQSPLKHPRKLQLQDNLRPKTKTAGFRGPSRRRKLTIPRLPHIAGLH
jgi:hypothetical protein